MKAEEIQINFVILGVTNMNKYRLNNCYTSQNFHLVYNERNIEDKMFQDSKS